MDQNDKDKQLLPIDPFRSFFKSMDDLFKERSENGNGVLQSIDHFFQNNTMFSSFPIEWQETTSQYIIQATLPGVTKNNIVIDLIGNQLSISVDFEQNQTSTNEIKYSKKIQSRTFTFQHPIQEGQIEADYKEGILTVVVNKADRKKITIL